MHEIDALRASFWTAAYVRSSSLRFVKGSEGRQSGEDVYQICKRRALEQHDSAFQATLRAKNDDSLERFSAFDSLFHETQKIYRSMASRGESSSSGSGSGSGSSSRNAFPLARVAELQENMERRRVASNNLESVNYSHILVDERPKKTHKKMAGYSTIGRSELVPKYVSDYDLRSEAVRDFEDEGIGEEEVVEEVREEEPRDRDLEWREKAAEKDFLETDIQDDDLFNNNRNCTKSKSKAVVDNEDFLRSVMSKRGQDFLCTSNEYDTSNRRAEDVMRSAVKRLVNHLAASSYEASNREELLMQLTRFMEQSAAESTYSQGE